MKVREIMTGEFDVVEETTSLLDAMRHLRERPLVQDEIGIKCVVVLDADGKLSGVLTQSDVVGEILFPYFVRNLADASADRRSIGDDDYRALAAWAGKVKVCDVMSRCPVTLGEDDDIFAAADAMVSRKVKSIPVVVGDRAVGIVYRSALYRHIAESILGRAEQRA